MTKPYGTNARNAAGRIADRYFVDMSTESVGGKDADHFKVLMGIFTYAGGRNTLLVWRPGRQKHGT